MDWGSSITYLGETRFKGRNTRFGIKDADRLLGLCLLGKVGSGRVPLLANMVLQDAARGMGVMVLDGAGNLAPVLLESLPAEDAERLIVLDPSDGEHPYSWNPIQDFRALPPERAGQELSVLVADVYQISPSPFTDFFAHAMLARPRSTLLFLYDVLSDAKAKDRAFPPGGEERAALDQLLKDGAEDAAYVTENGKYLGKDSLVRNLIGQEESKVSLSAFHEGGIVVVDFSRIRMYPTRITPLVRIFEMLARLNSNPTKPAALYLHDCLRYLPEEELDRFAERTLVVTASDSSHGEEEHSVREKAVQRAGTVITFAPHEMDAELAEHAFYPYVSPEELDKLGEGEFVVALAIDSVRSRPFFARALPMPPRSGASHQDLALLSRKAYSIPRLEADDLFKSGKGTESETEKGKGDSGSFSNAFRSIFTKGAKGAGPNAAAGADAPAAPQKPPPQAAPQPVSQAKEIEKAVPKKETPQKITPPEIPEQKLKKMLHVRKVRKSKNAE